MFNLMSNFLGSHQKSKLLRKKSKTNNFAATLLPPIFPLNRAFNAIWWQDGSKIKKNKISSLFGWKRWVRLRNAY